MKFLEKQISVKKALLVPLFICLLLLTVVSCDDQTTASNNNVTTAGNKWGDNAEDHEFLRI